MTKRKRDDDGTSGVQFGNLSASAAAPAASAPAPVGRRGPDPDPTSLRQQLQDGTARWLKTAVPVDVARAVHVAAAERETSPSDIVTQALRAFLKV